MLSELFADDSAFSENDLSFVDFDSFSSDDYTPERTTKFRTTDGPRCFGTGGRSR